MGLNKSDLIAVFAIIITVMLPIFGGTFSVLSGLSKSVSKLDITIARFDERLKNVERSEMKNGK